jgi:hypothetical protein
VDRAVDPLLLRAMTRRYVFGMLLYILAFALAFFSAALIVILALIFVLPEPEGPGSSRRTRRPPIRGLTGRSCDPRLSHSRQVDTAEDDDCSDELFESEVLAE